MNSAKKKILNDPVYGFIDMPKGLPFSIIEHPFFQRLRRIKQLGLTYLVYPGAIHSRFQHTLGATYLMNLAIDILRDKGVEISEKEKESAIIAILLHDIGHGPFSHSLEHSIINDISHEDISVEMMKIFNKEYDSQLDLALEIFNGTYHKKFLHQLVSSQLDVDRLDYLLRDSFFTGVSEGIVGSDRIIKMLNVVDNQLVVEVKGVYSIEKFLIARRLMYWQVYLHKTVIVAEKLLIQILKRAKYLLSKGVEVEANTVFKFFLTEKVNKDNLLDRTNIAGKTVLELFALIDDNDVLTAIKAWTMHSDFILSYLSKSLINRELFNIELSTESFEKSYVEAFKTRIQQAFNIDKEEADYFVVTGSISNNAYSRFDDRINIMQKDSSLIDIAEASDVLNLSSLSKEVEKYYLVYPKSFR